MYEGSCHNGHDIFRFLLALKCKHFKMGDNSISSIIGMLASFLPEDNIISKVLQEQATPTYKLLQIMNDMASLEKCLKVDVIKLLCNPCGARCVGP